MHNNNDKTKWQLSYVNTVRAKEYLTKYNGISEIQIGPKGNKLHTVCYSEFLLQLAILVPEIENSRTTTSEFQDFSRVSQDLCLFPGLSRTCMNPVNSNVHDKPELNIAKMST